MKTILIHVPELSDLVINEDAEGDVVIRYAGFKVTGDRNDSDPIDASYNALISAMCSLKMKDDNLLPVESMDKHSAKVISNVLISRLKNLLSYQGQVKKSKSTWILNKNRQF